jgi:hypothetical protein
MPGKASTSEDNGSVLELQGSFTEKWHIGSSDGEIGHGAATRWDFTVRRRGGEWSMLATFLTDLPSTAPSSYDAAYHDGQTTIVSRYFPHELETTKQGHAYIHNHFFPHGYRPINLPWLAYLSDQLIEAGLQLPYPQAEVRDAMQYLVTGDYTLFDEVALPKEAMFTFHSERMHAARYDYALAELEPHEPKPPIDSQLETAANYRNGAILAFYSADRITNAFGYHVPESWTFELFGLGASAGKTLATISGKLTRARLVDEVAPFYESSDLTLRIADLRFRDVDRGLDGIHYDVPPGGTVLVGVSDPELTKLYWQRRLLPKYYKPSRLRGYAAFGVFTLTLSIAAIAVLVVFLKRRSPTCSVFK